MNRPACIVKTHPLSGVAFSITDDIQIPNKWRKSIITYALVRGTQDILDQSLERKIINLAILRWSEEIPLIIRPVKLKDNPDIKIIFLSSSEDSYFAGDGSILAWSGYPETSLQGQMHFNDDYRWSKDGSPIKAHLADPTHYPDPFDPTTFKTYNLNQTFFHEFGHILGEVHIQTCPACIMYPYYNDTLELQPIEITRIQDKYGLSKYSASLYKRIKDWMHLRIRNE